MDDKPLPKTQIELSQDTLDTYGVEAYQASKQPIRDPKKRVEQRSVKDDTTQNFTVGLKDIDESIFYYFNNVIKPSVVQNGSNKPVPVIYGSQERWNSVQKDGFYRDKNGKIQAPLIIVKRNSVEKNRQLGNKMDANNPTHFQIFEKSYSKKNTYDRFSILNNRIPIKEYQAVVIPDYVNITYSCIIFTDYTEQMNKLVESINYASDSYWGDPQKFKFRAMIDSFSTMQETSQGSDKAVKTSFDIRLLGHIIPAAVNTLPQGNRKFFSKSSVTFGLETTNNINDIQ